MRKRTLKSHYLAPQERRTAMHCSELSRKVRPAARIWSGDRDIDRIGVRPFFEANGFAMIRGLLSEDEVTNVLAELDRVLYDWERIPNVHVIGTRNPLEPSYDIEDMQSDIKVAPTIRKITGLRKLSP